MLDADLASLYGVSTKRLNEQLRRNLSRFPEDFAFRLTQDEADRLRSQIATSKPGRGGRRYLPMAFTEHGAIMLASVLNSPVAVHASIQVVRAFVQLRAMLSAHSDLAHRLDELERRYDHRFQAVFDAIRRLMEAPESPPHLRIGFRAQAERSTACLGAGARVIQIGRGEAGYRGVPALKRRLGAPAARRALKGEGSGFPSFRTGRRRRRARVSTREPPELAAAQNSPARRGPGGLFPRLSLVLVMRLLESTLRRQEVHRHVAVGVRVELGVHRPKQLLPCDRVLKGEYRPSPGTSDQIAGRIEVVDTMTHRLHYPPFLACDHEVVCVPQVDAPTIRTPSRRTLDGFSTPGGGKG